MGAFGNIQGAFRSVRECSESICEAFRKADMVLDVLNETCVLSLCFRSSGVYFGRVFIQLSHSEGNSRTAA